MNAENENTGNRVSEAQKEVWEWKEKLYEQIKDLPKSEQLKFIMEQTEETVKKIKAGQKAKLEKRSNES